jgi:hypothetical protein
MSKLHVLALREIVAAWLVSALRGTLAALRFHLLRPWKCNGRIL